MRALYETRISDLGPDDSVRVDKTSVTTSASNVVTNIFRKQDGRQLILHHYARECLSS